MPSNIDPKKMQEARQRKQAERIEAQRRQVEEQAEMERQRAETQAELERTREVARAEYEQELTRVRSLYNHHEDLTSTVSSTYEEMDKLNRKNPKMVVTDLSLRMVNEAITDVKKFVADDPYLDRITTFEAAGDYITTGASA